MVQENNPENIRVIIGLGNPGQQYYNNRHNIGFRIVDQLAHAFGADWREKGQMAIAEIQIDGKPVMLVKPQTFMNSSGKVIPEFTKKGIAPEEILVVHDELELPFGKVKTKLGGSHKGHNGLKSIIQACGPDFWRLRYGIGRPEQRQDVPNYVLRNFSEVSKEVEDGIDQSVDIIERMFKKKDDA